MERKLMKGNEALAEAAMRAGCKCFFGYPITPQTEISAYLAIIIFFIINLSLFFLNYICSLLNLVQNNQFLPLY